ncbi:MAG: methylated-DNA--[protein]-cysteine S-methyltransferase [bacterium]|nr:methylated-DNA--[protein]-cysteine S-methyltransferase [bacterium]MDE0600812.1 methylated-DNA--[protein]-cysteine S-methyltransferase [bacterium]
MTLERELERLTVAAPGSVSGGVALGTGLSDGFSVFESPLGSVVVAFNPLGVSAVDLFTDGFEDRFAERFRRQLLEARPPRDWERLILQALAEGTPGSLPVDFRSVTAFQRQVLEETAAIPRGETRSYGWLAGRTGRPGAARAVGQTMARNPVPLVIPCHRVVLSNGRIGHYGLGGAERKRRLLRVEGAIS